MVEPKSCPFCREKYNPEDPLSVVIVHRGRKVAVYCGNCRAQGPLYNEEEIDKAIEAWNKRECD